VNLARQFQDALGRRCLARVDVGENADIPVSAKVFHFYVSITKKSINRSRAKPVAARGYERLVWQKRTAGGCTKSVPVL